MMNDKIKNMVDMAASDGVLSIEELKLIKNVAEKENINWDEVEFYILQTGAINEEQNEYDISNENLVDLVTIWLKRLEQGGFEGISEPFPTKKTDGNFKKATAMGAKFLSSANEVVKNEEGKLSRFDKFKMNTAKKVLQGTINTVPGGKLLQNVGINLIEQIVPVSKKYTEEEIKMILTDYLKIVEIRVKTKKIDESILNSFNQKLINLL